MFKIFSPLWLASNFFTFWGGGGGGGGKSTTTQSAQIDPVLRPYVNYGLTEAQKLYQGQAPQYFPGQTYVAPSQATQSALQMATQRATQGSPLVGMAQQNLANLQSAYNPSLGMFGDVYSRSGFNPANPVFGQAAYGGMQNEAGGLYRNIGANAQTSPELAQNVYSGLASGGMQNAALAPTSQTVSGAFLGSNPYFEQALKGGQDAATRAYNDAIRAAQSSASQAGRLGSNVSADIQNRAARTLAETLGSQAGQLAYQNYATERGLQESAMGRLGQLSQQDVANRLAGAQQLTGVGQQALANQLAAAQGLAGTSGQDIATRLQGATGLAGTTQQTLANQLAAAQGVSGTAASDLSRQLQAAQLAPSLAQADYADIAQLADVGKTQEQYQQMALEDQINRFNFQQNLPQSRLNQFLSQVYGAPQGSQATSTTSQSGGKIVCTAMNYAYGFGSFRQAIWLKHSENMHPAYERGYHALFLNFVMWAFDKKPGTFRKVCRKAAEHIARHRTADIWKQRRGKRDTLGMIYRAIFEPICFVAGWIKGE